VPAVAAIQEEQALFIIVGCKGYVGGFYQFFQFLLSSVKGIFLIYRT